jgi:hypothetical protein
MRLLTLLLLLAPPLICQVLATLTVQGIGGTTATLSASDISKLPQQTVKVTEPRQHLRASC